MTTLPEKILSGEVEAPDLFCGGTPCQAFSVAGLRQSLDDARGNLSLMFCEIANAIDTTRGAAGKPPAIIFWENVPGVLSTKDNAFGCFLAELAGEDVPLVSAGGKWPNAGFISGPKRTVAWRILDAQYFGVAQRRRRVFVVASARDGFDPSAVLFEFDGVRRDSAPSREAREIPAESSGSGATFSCAGIGAYTDDSASATLLKSGQDLGNGCEALITETFDFQSSGEYGTAPVAATLSARDYKSAKDLAVHSQVQPVAFHVDAKPDQMSFSNDTSATLTASQRSGVALNVSLRGRDGGATAELGDEVGNCLRASSGGGDKPHVLAPIAFQPGNIARGAGASPSTEVFPTLKSDHGRGASDQDPHVMNAMQVRRLTPVECERLQGFPDNYTDIPWRKKPIGECPDGPRYKALGNSWAVPVVQWIGKRIDQEVKAIQPVPIRSLKDKLSVFAPTFGSDE
jgi:DNA (cytosine-5)-methyltransferase 1